MLRTYSRLCNATIASRRVRFATIRLSSSTSSESQLGLRFHHPPDGQLDSSSPEPPKADSELSDAEWEIRTGKKHLIVTVSFAKHEFDQDVRYV